MGKTNTEADALSRIPREGYHKLESPVIKALLKTSQDTDWTDFNGNPTEIVYKSVTVTGNALSVMVH